MKKQAVEIVRIIQLKSDMKNQKVKGLEAEIDRLRLALEAMKRPKVGDAGTSAFELGQKDDILRDVCAQLIEVEREKDAAVYQARQQHLSLIYVRNVLGL